MHKFHVLSIFCIIYATAIFAQDYPYPLQPQNLASISTDSVAFNWKGASAFTDYTLEVYDCNYIPGPNFNSLQLQDYSISYDRNVSQGAEVSGFTNNEKRPGTFVGVEDSGADLLFHTFDFNVSTTYPIDNFQGSDFEGVTYLYDDYFAIIEERFGYLHLLKFNYNNFNLSNITLENTLVLSDPLISGANDGYEGVTYNPVTNKMYASKEYNPVTLFEFDLPTAPNFSEPLTLTKPFDINQVSWTPQDASGLYHCGLNKALSATKTGENLLILSKNSGAIYETDLNGNLISQLNFDLSGLLGSLVSGGFKAEGITYQDGIIWISEDNNGIYIGFENFNHQDPYAATNSLVYTQPNIGSTQVNIPTCLLQEQTEYCWRVIAHTASGENIESEYFSFTTDNFQTNFNAGAVCDDGDACTINDVQDGNCNCTGTPSGDSDNDGFCDAIDVCPNLNDALIGSSCNDGDTSTTSDIYTSNCTCEGEPCNAIGTPCNDNDSCTTNDIEDGNCNCAGTPSGDNDNDGICNLLDVCPNLNDALIGSSCNDGNANTINDVYTNACTCSGISPINNICISIENSNDDVEEYGSDGTMYFDSSDLEFVYDGNSRGNQTVGLRFNNIPIDQGADILSAYIQFTTDETNTGTTVLEIYGENTGHSTVFAAVNQNISSRQKTTNMVNWSPPNWSQVGETDMAQRTPDIASIIEEIINQQTYQAGNSMAIIINGSGERTAESYDGSTSNAPQLCIEYSVAPSCPAQGATCDDGNNCTINDVIIDNNCTCKGTSAAVCNTDICLGDVGIVNPVNLCNCIVTQQQINGCTNANACNYNPLANCDDGSCQSLPTCNADICAGDVESIDPSNLCNCITILAKANGCTNANACNYQPTANCDDNSCTYAPPTNLIHQNPTIIPGGNYSALQTIQSDISFTNFSVVNYYAEQLIELQSDFSIPLGKPFSAIIQPAQCE